MKMQYYIQHKSEASGIISYCPLEKLLKDAEQLTLKYEYLNPVMKLEYHHDDQR